MDLSLARGRCDCGRAHLSLHKTAGKCRAQGIVSTPATMVSLLKKIRSLAAKFLSSMTKGRSPPKENGVDSGGPIRFSSRLKDGRALAQDVWSIYKFVLIIRLPLYTTPDACAFIVTVLQISHQIASILVRGT